MPPGLRTGPPCRRTAGEIKVKSSVNVRELQKQVDGLSKELRQLEEIIQEKNWTTELLSNE